MTLHYFLLDQVLGSPLCPVIGLLGVRLREHAEGITKTSQASVRGIHRLVLPSQHVDQVEHRQVTVKDCVTPKR